MKNHPKDSNRTRESWDSNRVNEISFQEFWETDGGFSTVASFGTWLEISLYGPVRWDVFWSSLDVSKEPLPCHGDVESQRLALRPPV